MKTVYTGVLVSELFGYRDPPSVIRYPNKIYPNCLDNETRLGIRIDVFGYRDPYFNVKKLPKTEN